MTDSIQLSNDSNVPTCDLKELELAPAALNKMWHDLKMDPIGNWIHHYNARVRAFDAELKRNTASRQARLEAQMVSEEKLMARLRIRAQVHYRPQYLNFYLILKFEHG